jgi:hypothetical protein
MLQAQVVRPVQPVALTVGAEGAAQVRRVAVTLLDKQVDQAAQAGPQALQAPMPQPFQLLWQVLAAQEAAVAAVVGY